MFDARCVRNFYLLCCLAALAACSNGRGSVDTEQPPPSGPAQTGFTVSGTVAGLDGDGLVVQLNAGNDLAVPNNGTFTFTTQLADAASYSVTVAAQPTGPSQTCTIGNANGTIAAANVTNVTITCATGAFALRGTVSGLAGTGLVLQNNAADDLLITADGPFSFPLPYASGAAYNVSVETSPSGPSQSCTVTKGSGTIGSGDVTDVAVTCVTGTFLIGVTVSGLIGSGLVLQNNLGDDLTIAGNGSFQFSNPLATGALYSVTVLQLPPSPTQSCVVNNHSGTVGTANVTNITVTCMPNMFTVGGTIAGLTGSKLQLRLNNEPALELSAPAQKFTFGALLTSGTQYVVQVAGNPTNPAQDCKITRGERGTISNVNVTNVAVTCTTASFSIGGTVRGLLGKGLVLQKNGGDDRRIASDGDYTFQTKQQSGTNYEVKVSEPPLSPSQTCTIANPTGTVRDGDIRNVDVTCATNAFKINVTVSGLLGSGLVLMNNGGDDLPVPANGSFQFQTSVASDSDYDVRVRTPPSNPTQSCEVIGGRGTVRASDITNVAVSCSTSTFTVGGSITGLAGSGLVLRNNGGDDLSLDSGANSFIFLTPVSSGAQYSVTVAAQPTGPTQQCAVTPGTESGTVTIGNVASVQVTCVRTQFMIGGTVTGLTGSGLQLVNNGTDILAIGANGPFTFPASLPNGGTFNITIDQHPVGPSQVCTVNPVAGTVSGADVTNIDVSCVDVPL
ncbi:MAG: hypothetical protein ACREXP_02520 [Steroidobacteraceae bacterium]